jgi:hypothetical protein
MRARRVSIVLLTAATTALVSSCAADPTEEKDAGTAAAITVPECTPAPKNSQGECAANEASDALLEEYITQCPFGVELVTRDWTEDFGWIWWNPANPSTTSALGVELATGQALCT